VGVTRAPQILPERIVGVCGVVDEQCQHADGRSVAVEVGEGQKLQDGQVLYARRYIYAGTYIPASSVGP
jgi:hypothetical protein